MAIDRPENLIKTEIQECLTESGNKYKLGVCQAIH